MRSYDIGHRSIEAAIGDRFRVTLEAASSGGYVWKIVTLPAGLRLLGDSLRPSSTAIGAPTRHEFRFEVVTAVKDPLVFEHARPWDSTGERHELTIRPPTPARP